MNSDINNLIKKFNLIKNLGWIKSKRKGSTGIGYTFETLIGKEEEKFPVPDFGNIEIKTKNNSSKENITLFNATPDGDYLFPIKYLYEKYGFRSIKEPNCKVFYATISTEEKYAGKNYRFRLNLDDNKKEIRIIAIDKTGRMENTYVTWTYELIENKVKIKIKKIALIKANSKYINNEFYYKYDEIHYYEIKNIETFIKLIKEGIIKIIFKVGMYKDGEKKGQIDNHGTGFCINEKDLEKLYNKIF